jgi:hypothetical protein
MTLFRKYGTLPDYTLKELINFVRKGDLKDELFV